MINLLKTILISTVLFTSCDKPERRWRYEGVLTSVRIDDDSEYHFTTDEVSEDDESKIWITIERSNVSKPELWILEERCPDGKTCNETHEWTDVLSRWKFVLPNDYKIETFDD